MKEIDYLNRRHDLDWLRVLVFGLLIFYHIGMLYVADWGYHYKSQYSSEFLQNLMLLVNRWRLPLLFLISGVAIRFILDKVTWYRFIGLRAIRLLIPLAFGVLVVVPPQLYIEMTANGDLSMSYWSFYQAFFDLDHPLFENYQAGILPHMDVNHLWYIRELWWFSLILLPFTFLLNNKWVDKLVALLGKNNSFILLILIPSLLITCVDLLFFPDSGEDRRIRMGFTFLVFGYLIAKNSDVWKTLYHNRKKLLVAALCSYVALLIYYHMYWTIRTEPLTGLAGFAELLFSYFNRWSWLAMILAYSMHFLNHSSKRLHYFNEAVYPYYILHQSILIVAAFWLSQWQLGPFFEPTLVILITFFGCALGFSVIRKFKITRLLFGLKWNSKDKQKTTQDIAPQGETHLPSKQKKLTS